MVTIYSTAWCGYCVQLKVQLDKAGITYQEVNIDNDPSAADYVMRINNGNQTVPTVEFPDGSALTNPSLRQVKEKLAVS